MVDVVDRSAYAAAPLKRISWGAIIAGTILALVFQIMLALLGLGIGLATLDPQGGDNPTLASFGSASGIWAVLTILIATFLGAYAAARFAGSASKRDGALHGITTWATATLVAVYLLTSGASSLVTTAFGALGSTVSSLGSAVQGVVPDSLDALPPELQQQARQLLARGEDQAQQAAGQVQDQAQQAADQARQTTGEQDLGAAVSQIFQGLGQDATPQQRSAAVQMIASQAGISQAEAEQRLNQFQQQYDQAVEQARQAAGQAADAASGAAFAAFVGLLLGLAAGAVGGLVGRTKRTVGYYRD
ncbi:PhnA-like protein [Aureimonas flava]|uniref:PhnA-like protein n=1 Tax=Aureimonas flava TaxID=2320271 RepID=A0A3A1WPM7_9HYPH|nr:PhnA-like protein [Aureimonas flava]RIY01952.1 PhnA-like protein [Aureimonas flava]